MEIESSNSDLSY